MHEPSFFAVILQWISSNGFPFIISGLVFGALLIVNMMISSNIRSKLLRPMRARSARVVLRNAAPIQKDRQAAPNIADPKEQLEAVSRVGFETRRLLNREEVPVLRLLEQTVREANAGFRVMAQTSLGEIIRPKPNTGSEQELQLAFRSINSKRLDFGIFDRFGRLVVAVEYQGSGHYHQTSFMRDAVKHEALRKAGVQVIAINEGFRAVEVLPTLRRALGMPPMSVTEERKPAPSRRSAA